MMCSTRRVRSGRTGVSCRLAVDRDPSRTWRSTHEAQFVADVRSVLGITFAPPPQISISGKSPNGTVITLSPTRTGIPSGVQGKIAALTIHGRHRHARTCAGSYTPATWRVPAMSAPVRTRTRLPSAGPRPSSVRSGQAQ
jgi:hypothetical protein